MIVKTKPAFPEYYPTGNKQVYQQSSLMEKNDTVEIKQTANFTGTPDAVKKTGGITTKSLVHKFIQSADNSGLYEGLIAPVLACFIRPISILSLPGSEKRDKQYAASQSIATGIVSFVSSMLIYTPLDEAIKNVNKNLEKTKWLNDPTKMTIFKNLVSGGIKIATYGAIAAIMINTVPPVMNLLFPKKNKAVSKDKMNTSEKVNIQKTSDGSSKKNNEVSSLGYIKLPAVGISEAVFKNFKVSPSGGNK